MSSTSQEPATSSVSEAIIVQSSIDSSATNSVTAMPVQAEREINRNKPWRIVIRRSVSDGGSDYENIPGTLIDN